MTKVEYRVQVYDFGANYGIGPLISEFDRAKNVGTGKYANEVPECFFTLNQDDPKVKLLRGHDGRVHLRILRNGELYWTGWGSLEIDASDTDVILYGYGYLAGTYWTDTAWNVQWQNAQISTIVSDTWTRCKSGLTNSRLAFVATGTIEAPVTTSGGSTPIVLPTYSAFYKRGLDILREMAAISISDTTNTVVFEITDSVTPTFNFWKNRGVDRPDVVLRWGDQYIRRFHDYRYPVYHRNDIPVVGSAPNNTLLQYEWTDSADMATWGRMMEPLYFSWVRDQTELQRAVSLRGALARRNVPDLSLLLAGNSLVPPGLSTSRFGLTDRIRVEIDRGLTSVSQLMMVTGVQTLWMNGVEHVNLLLQEPLG